MSVEWRKMSKYRYKLKVIGKVAILLTQMSILLLITTECSTKKFPPTLMVTGKAITVITGKTVH